MKLIVYIISFNVLLFAAPALSKNCEECPGNKPCKIIIPKGDKCNTCEVKVHCSDGFWYQNEKVCTYIDCNHLTPIENPYQDEKEESI